MSLISDALKEAQRERSERREAESSPALLHEAFFSATPAQVSRPRTILLVIAVVVVVSGIGAAIATRVAFSSATSRPAGPAKPAGLNASSPVTTRRDRETTSVASAVAVPRSPSTAVAARPVGAGQIENRTATKRPVAAPQPVTVGAPGTTGDANTSRKASRQRTPAKQASSAQMTEPSLPAEPRSSAPIMRIVVEPGTWTAADSIFARAFDEHTHGNLDAAAELYEKALHNPPVAPGLYNDYGALLATRGKHAAAIAMYNLGLRANEKDSRLWTNLGASYRAVGRQADALGAYLEAAKLDPANISVKIRLAGEYASLGDTASARREFEAAVKSAPGDAEARYAYGAFLNSQRDYRAALRELRAFLDLAPGKYTQDIIDRTKTAVSTLSHRVP